MQKNILNFESFIRKSFVVLTIVAFMAGGLFVAAPSAQAANWDVNNTLYADDTNCVAAQQCNTIQAAIDAASPGDIINVAAGTYVEDLLIEGKDNLVLSGTSGATIKGATLVDDALTFFAEEPNIMILSDGVKIHGFTIESKDSEVGSHPVGITIGASNVEIYDNDFKLAVGSSFGVAIVTYCDDTFCASGPFNNGVDISGLNIHDNTFTSLSGTGRYQGIYLNPDIGTGLVTIQDNTFDGALRVAVSTERSNVLIDENIIDTTLSIGNTNRGVALVNWYGNTISDVTISGNSIDGFLEGIRLSFSDLANGVLENITVSGNTIINSERGVHIYNSANEVTLSDKNAFSGNTFAVQNDDIVEVNAIQNWWGDATGPTHLINNPDGTGDEISDNVLFDPWYIDAAMTTLSDAPDPDTTPDQFAFTDQTGVALSTVIESDIVEVSGINAPADISVTGGEYKINAGTYTATAGTVNNGDDIRVRHTSSSSNSTAVNTVLTIGGVSDTFTSTTVAASGGGGGGGGGGTVICQPGQTTFCQPASGQGQVLGASTGPIPGCDMRTTGFSTVSGVSCANNTPHSGQIPGCDTRTSGFSTTTGQSCVGNVPQGAIAGCDMRTTGFSTVTGQSCATNVPHGQVLGATTFTFTLYLRAGPPYATHLMNEVVQLQTLLNARGYVCGPVDGKFGPLTRGCVVRFQIASALVGDGIVGPLTRAVLNR